MPQAPKVWQTLRATVSAHGVPVAPAYPDVESQFVRIFQQYRAPHGVVLRHQRLLWQAYLPK
jgi:hypothetical protein